MRRHYDDDEDDEPKEIKPTWPAIRDLFEQLIKPAKDWEHAQIIADSSEMAGHFMRSYPDTLLLFTDMRLALHDLNIPYERNEHNNKFYYLADWR